MLGEMVMPKVPKEWEGLPAVLSAQQAAELLQVHENTVKNWIREGKLPAFKAGRVIRIYRADFFEFAGVGENEE